MAHPFHKFNEEDAGHARAKAFTAKKRGGGVKKRADGGSALEDENMDKGTKERNAPYNEPVPGKKAGGRLDKYARGGRAKHKGNNTKINIVVAPKGPHPADGAAPPAPLGGGPLMGPPGPPPGGPPPGLGGPPPGLGGPPGGIPGMGGPKPPGMMKRGGAVKKYASGGSTQLTKPVKVGIKMKAGSDTGVGRRDQAHIQKKDRLKGG